MHRTKQTTVAAVLLLIYSALGAALEVPNLARGANTGPDEAPFAMTLFSFALNLSGVFAAYGLWGNMKWGKVLSVALQSVAILYSLVPLLVAPPPLKLMAGIGIAISVAIIALVLWRSPRPATA